jgi:hypothetical protein
VNRQPENGQRNGCGCREHEQRQKAELIGVPSQLVLLRF